MQVVETVESAHQFAGEFGVTALILVAVLAFVGFVLWRLGNRLVDAIATTATDGFVYLGSCSGKPTGTPTAKTGRVPLVYDSTNEVFYAYTGGAWAFVGAKSSAFECQLGGAIADGTYTMVTYATFAFRILGIYGLKHTSGSSVLDIKINSTVVTGLSALAVSSTPQNATASGAWDVAVGNAVNFVISSGSSPIDLLSSLKIARM